MGEGHFVLRSLEDMNTCTSVDAELDRRHCCNFTFGHAKCAQDTSAIEQYMLKVQPACFSALWQNCMERCELFSAQICRKPRLMFVFAAEASSASRFV